MPKFERPISFDTSEADVILSALEVFPPDNPWNIPVDKWPVADNSAEMIALIGADKPLRGNADMAFVLVPPNQKKIDVKLAAYAAESDVGPYPVPESIPIEGWPAEFMRDPSTKSLTLDDVQRGKPSLDADRHGIVVDPVNRKLYEFYRLTKTTRAGMLNRHRYLTLVRIDFDLMDGPAPMLQGCPFFPRSSATMS